MLPSDRSQPLSGGGFLALERQALEESEENYRRLIASARRARRLADAGRLPEFQLDQALQDELRARLEGLRGGEVVEPSRRTPWVNRLTRTNSRWLSSARNRRS